MFSIDCKAVCVMTFKAKYLDVTAENMSPYTRKLNPILGVWNLLEENKPRSTNDLQRKEKENTALCRN